MQFIDLFCGAGLGARGAVAGGATPVLAIDNWQPAVDAYELNFPDADVVHSDLEKLDPSDYAHVGQVDLILGSPECTAHSIARGSREGSTASRDGAFTLLDWTAAFSPRWVVIENVTRLKAWPRLGEFKKKLSSQGYHVSQFTLNAVDFGVPQSRRRLFLIANKLDIDVDVPKPDPKSPQLSAQSIIDFSGKYESRNLYIKNRAADTKDRAKRAIASLGRRIPFLIVYYGSDYAGGWQKIDAPLRTVTTIDRFGLVTWSGNTPKLRMLQPPELLRAMGADDHLLPQTTRRNKIRLCGNGICAPIVKNIVEQIKLREQAARAMPLKETA